MRQLNLASIPDQSFTTVLNATRYDIRIFLAGNVMCCDLSINSVAILSSQRLVAGSPFIPYSYLENGNFFISTYNDELPYYEQFGATQFLLYFTQAELSAAAIGSDDLLQELGGE
jgi:hypothetical protein